MTHSTLKALAVAVGAVVLSGCAAECIDKYDCRKFERDGQQFTCNAGRCEVGTPGGNAGGTGSEAGGTGTAGGATAGGGTGTAGGATAGGGSAGGTAGGGRAGGGAAGGATAGGATAGGGTAGGATAGGGSAGGATAGGAATFSGTYVAELSGSQQIPPVVTLASGSATFTLSAPDGGSYSLAWNVTHDAGLPTAAHIHLAWAGSNGPVPVVDLMSATSPITGGAAVSNLTAQRIATGFMYVNVHTTPNMNGEIRGQILKPGQFVWTAALTGAEVAPVPVVGADAGAFGVLIDPGAGNATYFGSWQDTPGVDAGIYQGGPGGNGPLVQAINPDGTMATFPITGLAMGDGGFYVQVHTAANPGGEIRGQLTPKP